MQPSTGPQIIIHKSPPQYVPRDFRIDPILAVGEKYSFSKQTKFSVHNKSLKPSLKFREVSSQKPIFRCKGKVFSLTDKKVLEDGESGQTILTIKKEFMSLVGMYKIHDKENKEICKISVERTATKAKLFGKFIDTGGLHRERSFMVKANLEMKRCCIYLQEDGLSILGTMEKLPSSSGSLLADEEYLIEVEAGVDGALIIALCVIVIEENTGVKTTPLSV